MFRPYYRRTLKYTLEELWSGDSKDLIKKYSENIDNYNDEIKELITFLEIVLSYRRQAIGLTPYQADIEVGMIALILISLEEAAGRPENDSELTDQEELIFRKLVNHGKDERDSNKN